MHSYAQTNIELFNQLRHDGYSKEELDLVRDAYELARDLFTGRFQPSGKSFVAHVVGTASILGSLRLPAPIVAAGLLHNVYGSGDFGDGDGGISTVRRRRIRRIVGAEAEEYIAKFYNSHWKLPSIQVARNNPDKLNVADRNVILILLADYLEHLLDLDLLYYADDARRHYIKHGSLAVEIAESMNLSSLAAELKRAIRETQSTELPIALPSHRIKHASFVIPPLSCQKRFSVVLGENLNRGVHLLRSKFRRLLNRRLGNLLQNKTILRARMLAQGESIANEIAKPKIQTERLRK